MLGVLWSRKTLFLISKRNKEIKALVLLKIKMGM